MSLKHIVKQGEYLSLIGAHYGFPWRTIYDHPANAQFKKKRPNPNLIYPGDELFIPDRAPRVFDCAVGKLHRFKAERQPDVLILVLKGSDGAPLASEACEIEFDAGAPAAGASGGPETKSTNGKGELRLELPFGASHAKVTLVKERALSWQIAIGHLDPVRDMDQPFDPGTCKVTGIQARLNNLGYDCGRVDGNLGAKTERALRDFQERVLKRSEPDGRVDQETCDRLVAEHGS